MRHEAPIASSVRDGTVAVIAWLAEEFGVRRPDPGSSTAIGRLCHTGARGMGAVELFR